MSTYKVWAYDTLSNEETFLFIDARSLLFLYSPEKKLKGTYQLSDQVTIEPNGDIEADIIQGGESEDSINYKFENTETRDEFVLRLRRACKKYEKTMQGILMEISIHKSCFVKFNSKNSQQNKKYFWFSPDLAEIRWAGTKNPKKFSKININEIVDITYGPWSQNFEQIKSKPEGKLLPYHLCLTIHTTKKTIDLQAPEEKQLRIWLSCLYYVIQAKNILTKNQFTLNKFPFLRFRQKITQTAHKIGLTFSTYLKLRFNRVIYNYTCSSPQLVIHQKHPEPFTHDVSRYNQLQDKSRLSFIRHKRNTTLPGHQPNSFEERRAVPLTGQILQPVPFYTDRRSQMNELSRHSSASNVSLNNPLSQRVDHPYSNSNNSFAGYSNTHPTNKTIEIDYGVENHASMARSNLIRHPFRTDSRSTDSLSGQRERERATNLLQQPQSISKHSNNVLDKNSFKAHTTRQYEGSPVNLYFNVEGSKEMSGVIPSNLINETTPGKLLPDNLNLDFTKITSPPANTSSTGNSQKKSDGLGGSKKFSPSVGKDENTRGKKGSGSKEKEHISPEDSESKRSAKLKMIPLNLRNALNEKADSGEKLKKDSFIGVSNSHEPQPLRIVHKKKNSKSQNSHTKISSALDNIIKSQQRKTDRKSFLEEKSLEKSADRSRYTAALQVDSSTLKKRVKVNIDKHVLKAKIMKALQSSHTPTGGTNSHTLNHSFNYDALPGNISVDISKLDIDLDILNRSLLNVHDEKEEDQYTSRFVGGENYADSAKQRREANKENMPVNLPDKGVSLIKNVNLGQKEGKKIMPLLERPQNQKKSHLSLDTTVINLENENNILKQSLEGLAKEKKKYKDRSEHLDKDLKKTQQELHDEIKKKDMFIKSLLRNVDGLTQERDDLLHKMSELIKQNGFYLEKETQRQKEMRDNEDMRAQEVERLQGHIEELKKFQIKLNTDLENYKRNNLDLEHESERMQDTINKLSQEKDTYRRRVLSPKMMDEQFTSRAKIIKEENDMLKESLEKERKNQENLKRENEKLKRENEGIKRLVKAKIGSIQDTVRALREEKEKLKSESEDNYEGFAEVWPHLLNIYEYQSDQNMQMEVRCFTMSKENELLRAQLRKRIENR